MSSPLADKIQIWGFHKNSIIYTDGSLGFALNLSTVDVSCWDEARLNDFKAKSSSFLNGLSSNIHLQFVQDIKAGNDEIISSNEALSLKAKDELVRDIGKVRTDFYKSLDKEGLLPKHGLKLIVRRSLSKSLISKPKLLSKAENFPEILESALLLELKSLNNLKNDIMSSLLTMGINSSQVSSREIMELTYEQWNPTRNIMLHEYDKSDVRGALTFTDAHPNSKGFDLSNMHHRVISLKILPSQTFSGMAAVLRELPFDSRLFLSIRVPDQQKEIESLQLSRRLAFSMVYGKNSGVSDIESTAKLEDLEQLLGHMIAQGEKVFHVGLNILLRSESEDELREKVSQTLLKLREMSGAEGLEESLAAFDIFTSFALPHAKCSERTKRLKTSNLSDMLPVYGPWEGHKEPHVLLRSRFGSLIKFNPFSRSLTNANQVISGGSGSGKSFLTNLLLIQMLKNDPQIFIVDIGGSYQKTCENLSGQYVPLGIDQGLSINPFDLGPDEKQPSNEKIKFLLAFIETITKEDDESGLKKLERSELEKAIEKVYTSSTPCMSVLKDILLHHENPNMVKLGKILRIWSGDTPYGRFLDRSTNVELNKSTVCFDLKGLEQYEDLQRACLLMISDLVVTTSQKDKTRMKFLVFDECWKLLEDGEGSQFIGSIFRTCRKYFMSCIAISQNMDDFATSSVASAILSNSSIKWILKQKGADKDRLKKVLKLNDTEIELIFSLHQERGMYSESFLMCEDDKSVVAVESTPPEYWLATTDPKDLGMIDEYKLKNPEMNDSEVLFKLAQDYPHGATSI